MFLEDEACCEGAAGTVFDGVQGFHYQVVADDR